MLDLIRQSVAQLLRRPGASLLLVLLLALGIGVNAGMFAVAQQALVRPLPVPEPENVVRIFSFEPAQSQIGNASYPWLESIANELPVFEAVGIYLDWGAVNLSVAGAPPERARSGFAAGAFFESLGVTAMRGRNLAKADDGALGAHPVVVLTERFWRQRFQADPQIIGSEIRINRESYQVIGVLQPGFESPNLATPVDVWLPMAMAPQAMAGVVAPGYRTQASLSWLDAVARIKPGETVGSAQAALDAWTERKLAERAPDAANVGNAPHAKLFDLRAAAVDPYGTEQHERNAWLLLGVALLVLGIAAANAAGLIAVRSEERVRDFAVRNSLGAGRRQLLAMLLAEASMLIVLALVLGSAFAWVLVHTIVWLAPPGLALPGEAWASLRSSGVLVAAIGCAMALMLIVAAVPVRHIGRMNVIDALRSGGRGGTADASRQRFRSGLVAGQLALTLVLLTAAVSLVQTLQRTSRVELGFIPERVLAASIPVARPGLDGAGETALQARLLESARALPGVTSAGWINTAPVQDGGMRTTAESDVDGTPKGSEANVDVSVVSPGAIETLGIQLLQGRLPGPQDDGKLPVVVVNRAYAERFLPGTDPLARKVVSLAEGGAQVVGVVANSKRRTLREEDIPQLYVPATQFSMPSMTLLLRTELDPLSLAPALQKMVAAIDPELPVYRTRVLSDQLASSETNTRVFAGLLAGFAILSALLAAAGIYGLLSYWLRMRERELGIRIAIGAGRRAIAGLVLGQGGVLLLGGIIVGMPLVLAAARVVDGLLFGMSAADPAVVFAALGLLLVMVALACALPLRRALRTDAMQALRAE